MLDSSKRSIKNDGQNVNDGINSKFMPTCLERQVPTFGRFNLSIADNCADKSKVDEKTPEFRSDGLAGRRVN